MYLKFVGATGPKCQFLPRHATAWAGIARVWCHPSICPSAWCNNVGDSGTHQTCPQGGAATTDRC